VVSSSVILFAAGSDEEYYCTSTLPSQFASVQQPNSRCMRVPPPPPLPDGTKGFVPAVRVIQLVCASNSDIPTDESLKPHRTASYACSVARRLLVRPSIGGTLLPTGGPPGCQVKPALVCLAQVFPGTKSGPESPAGFATLKTLQVSPDVRQAGVAVFGRPSGKESLILKVKVRREHSLLSQDCIVTAVVGDSSPCLPVTAMWQIGDVPVPTVLREFWCRGCGMR
jgi:Exoribonuclease Xrn1 D1 domain